MLVKWQVPRAVVEESDREAGRKPKTITDEMRERLDPYEEAAIKTGEV